jgi:mRNA-degrading endonuclease RelE of RelBE toxin-antitoxin system
MAGDPFSGDIVKLEGDRDRYRRRAGSYRIFFRVERSTRTAEISAVVRRTSTTYS